MKNEEIVKALRRLKVETGSLVCMGCGREHDCDIHGCRIVREAAELIEKLTDRCARYAEEIAVAQDQQRWIPVTERLPELQSWGASTVVLGLIKNENAHSLNKLHDLTLCVYVDNGIWSMPGRYAAISHWMPLPAPPEEVE